MLSCISRGKVFVPSSERLSSTRVRERLMYSMAYGRVWWTRREAQTLLRFGSCLEGTAYHLVGGGSYLVCGKY